MRRTPRLSHWPLLIWIFLIVANLPPRAQAQEPTGQPLAVRRAIDRGLAFLARDAVAWKTEHNCSSCHHAALIVWSMHEAKVHGHVVDEPVLADLTRWLAEAGEGRFNQARPAEKPRALNPKAIYYGLGLSSLPSRTPVQNDALKLLLTTVKGDQTEEGSWMAWPESRPPILGPSDEKFTLLASLALLPATASGDAEARAALDKAVQWLESTPSDHDPQSIALRLVLWTRLGRPPADWLHLASLIVERQNPDGGWSQTKDAPSDAWATGQALYALSHAGLGIDETAMRRGREFLIKTQLDDGSWRMASRPSKPGGTGADSLIPIAGAGSAWAVMGLARIEHRSAIDEPAVKHAQSVSH